MVLLISECSVPIFTARVKFTIAIFMIRKSSLLFTAFLLFTTTTTSMGNHIHLSLIREIIVLAIVKIGQGEAESKFFTIVCTIYSLIG